MPAEHVPHGVDERPAEVLLEPDVAEGRDDLDVGPASSRTRARTVSSSPGRQRTSIRASAASGMTLCLYPACSTVGFDVVCSAAWMKRDAEPVASAISSGPVTAGSTPRNRATSVTIASVVADRRTGHSSLPMRATAAASFVTALSRMTCEPCAAVPVATSLSHSSAFSPVCSR